MSWIDDNFDDLICADLHCISKIEDKLNNDKYIEKLYKKLEEDYTILVCDILNKYNNGQRLSDKQKRCLARYIYENDLENILEE